jgi:hypothetical protein
MATASIVFFTQDGDRGPVVWIDNRGSEASLETDLGEAFDTFAPDLSKPGRVAAQVLAWYSVNKSTVAPECRHEADWGDSTHINMDCATPDGSGRPTAKTLIPSDGDETDFVYGG